MRFQTPLTTFEFVMRNALLPIFLTAALSGCAMGSGELADVDPGAAPDTPTWTEHVEPVVNFYCRGCHSKDAQPGAQEDVAYDSCAETKREWGEFRETVFDENSMPPGGADRLRPWELMMLARWWEQGGTCD